MRGIRIDKSDIQFEKITELKIANEQPFIEIVIKQCKMMVLRNAKFEIGNHRCL